MADVHQPVTTGFYKMSFYTKLAAGTLALTAALFPVAAAQELPFYDLPTDHWAYESVRNLAELGVLQGYPDGRFDGTRAVTRFEMATVAARLLQFASDGVVPTASNGDVSERLGTVEDALRNATSLSYTQRLETRVAALEAALFAETGADLPVPATPAEPPSAADALGDGASEDAATEGGTDSAADGTIDRATDGATDNTDVTLGGLRLVDIRFSARPERPFFIGVSPGVVSTAGDVYLSVQAGYDGLIGPVGPVGRLTFNGAGRELRLSLDALTMADLPVDGLRVYGGLGFGGTVRPGGGSLLLEAPFGTEYAVTPRLGLFVQLTTSYSFAPIYDVAAELSSGINLRF